MPAGTASWNYNKEKTHALFTAIDDACAARHTNTRTASG